MSQSLKNIIGLTLFIALVIFLSNWKGCDLPRYIGDDTLSTTQTRDTVFIPLIIFKDTSSKPQPVKYIDTGRIIHDTIPAPPAASNTAASLVDYHSTYIYDDSIPVPYGYAKIKDTVNKNRITGRGFNLFQDIPKPVITITNTATVRQKPKRITFGIQTGVGVMYNNSIHFGPYVGLGVNFRLNK